MYVRARKLNKYIKMFKNFMAITVVSPEKRRYSCRRIMFKQQHNAAPYINIQFYEFALYSTSTATIGYT